MVTPITCPLCSQPGFSDVDSLRMTLIRVTTRQLACPICQEVLFGLDKLTIHLVSHSLHEHLLHSSQSSNISSALTLSQSQGLRHSHVATSVPSLKPAEATTSIAKDGPMASYIVLNFPCSENSQGFCEAPVENIKGALNNDTSASTSSDVDQDVSSSHNVKFDEAKYHVVQVTSQISDAIEPIKFDALSKSLLEVQNALTESPSSSVKSSLPKNAVVLDRSPDSLGLEQPRLNDFSPLKECNLGAEISLDCQTPADQLVKREMSQTNFPLETADSSVVCGICGLTLRDRNIAMLHQQLVHCQNNINHNLHESRFRGEHRSVCSDQWQEKGSSHKEVVSSFHRYPCHICNKVFRMRGSLMVHIRVAHSSSGKLSTTNLLDSSSYLKPPSLYDSNVDCKVLSETFSFKEAETSSTLSGIGLTEDKLSEHRSFDCGNSSYVNQTENQKSSQEKMSVVSSQPDLKVRQVQSGSGLKGSPLLSRNPSPSSISGKVELVSIFPCNLCNKTYSKETLLTQHLKTHDSKQWECDVCFKTFTTKYFLKKHKRLHTGEMPYTCAICSKSFTFQQSYHKHLLYHSDEKPHACNECGRAFKELSTLHNHQRIHTGEKPWACETCGKCFRQRVSYLVHRRIHTGAMPYQCTACSKSFRYKVSQRTHKCIAQTTGEDNTQQGEVLQRLLINSSSKEAGNMADLAGALPCSTSAGSHAEPHKLLKEQLLQLSIKEENQSNLNVSNLFLQLGGNESCDKLKEKQPNNQQDLNSSKISDNQCSSVQLEPMVHNVHHDSNQSRNYCGFFRGLPQAESEHNEFLSTLPSHSNFASKSVLHDDAKSSFDLSVGKPLLPTEHESIDSSNQTTASSSADLSIDFFQDILDMVMPPSCDNVSSPSAQMGLLSLSGPSNDDSESGLELRQLLYGSCDADNAP